jgi:hypothetical protein
MRHLANVIDRMVKEIPETETDLLVRLADLRSSALYASPEIMPMWFRECAQVLNEEAVPIDAPWKEKIAAIFGDRE